MYDAFYPGQVWLDTEGKRIQAHGGSVIYIDDTYYWYGENKEKQMERTESGIGEYAATARKTFTTGRMRG